MYAVSQWLFTSCQTKGGTNRPKSQGICGVCAGGLVCVVFLGCWLVFGILWFVRLCGILSMIDVCGILGLVGWCVIFYGWRCVVFSQEISGSDTWSWCWDLTFGGIGLVVSSWINPFLFSSIKPTYVQFLIVRKMFRSRMWGVLKVFEKELTE